MNHFSNITRRGLIQAIVVFMVILSIFFLIFQNMVFVAAGGALVVIVHLIVVSGVIYFAGNLFVQSLIKLHQPTS